MKLIYNGTNLLPHCKPMSCRMHDQAGGAGDWLTVTLSDAQALWPGWEPQRGDTLRLQEGDFDSGILFVDDLIPMPGTFRILAVSVPLEARRVRTKIWRDVTLLELAGDIARQTGLKLSTFFVDNPTFCAITQGTEGDISFLTRICAREGIAVKVSDQTLILFGERAMEDQTPVVTISRDQCQPGYRFRRGTGLMSSCTVAFSPFGKTPIRQTAYDSQVSGGMDYRIEPCANDGEALRFAAGFLRQANKYQKTADLPLLHMTQVAAGSTVALSGFGPEDGAWFVEAVDQDPVHQTTYLTLRKGLSY